MKKLCKSLEDRYDVLYTHYPFYGRKCKLGEIDIVGIKGKHIHVYEVKCSPRIVKARKQLSRIKRLLKHNQVKTFFYCGASNRIMEVMV
ncbi:hypothetical protein HYS48_02925 [Candidatus Woesearchaeota archaeon]|nr:hypothetical protein [Candidatus Woesearchaeota archaeon]